MRQWCSVWIWENSIIASAKNFAECDYINIRLFSVDINVHRPELLLYYNISIPGSVNAAFFRDMGETMGKLQIRWTQTFGPNGLQILKKKNSMFPTLCEAGLNRVSVWLILIWMSEGHNSGTTISSRSRHYASSCLTTSVLVIPDVVSHKRK